MTPLAAPDAYTRPTVDALVDEDELFRRVAEQGDREARNLLVQRYMGLAGHIARRFSHRGIGDDVRQAAMIGLIKAVDRFDPTLGFTFSAFAGTTIEGELKRYLRDKTWVVRVPRSSKELHLAVRRATDELQQRLKRSPRLDELAAHLGVDRDDVVRGLAASAAFDVGSIDAPMPGSEGRVAELPSTEAGFERMLDSELIGGLLARLPEREREIVRMRFFEELSQAEIAERIGISQMHVSRLLRKSFEVMRTWLDPDALDALHAHLPESS